MFTLCDFTFLVMSLFDLFSAAVSSLSLPTMFEFSSSHIFLGDTMPCWKFGGGGRAGCKFKAKFSKKRSHQSKLLNGIRGQSTDFTWTVKRHCENEEKYFTHRIAKCHAFNCTAFVKVSRQLGDDEKMRQRGAIFH